MKVKVLELCIVFEGLLSLRLLERIFYSPKFAVIPSKSLGFLFLGLPFCRGVGGAPLKKGFTTGSTGVAGNCVWWWWNSGLGNGGG